MTLMRQLRLLIVGFTVLTISACGITAPRNNVGFAHLESLGVGDTDRVTNISIGPTLLHLAARYVDDDPEVRRLLKNLEGVRVRIYEIDGDASRVATRIDDMSQHLQADGWDPVVLVREKNEETHMLLRMVDGRISGMTVLTSDGESEAVVVNLMGDIQPEQFSGVMLALDVDAPGTEHVRIAEHEKG